MKTKEHYPMEDRKKLVGTARYASINALKGLDQSRRDDLEAVGYVLMYFLKGNLPWQGLVLKTKQNRYKKIMEKKEETTPAELCNGFPSEFEEYVSYTRNLEFKEEPKYEYLIKLFDSAVRKCGGYLDGAFDWNTEQRKVELRNKYLNDSNKDDITSVPGHTVSNNHIDSNVNSNIHKSERNITNTKNHNNSKDIFVNNLNTDNCVVNKPQNKNKEVNNEKNVITLKNDNTNNIHKNNQNLENKDNNKDINNNDTHDKSITKKKKKDKNMNKCCIIF